LQDRDPDVCSWRDVISRRKTLPMSRKQPVRAPGPSSDVELAQQLFDWMFEGAQALLKVIDPLEAELLAAMFEPVLVPGVDAHQFAVEIIPLLEAKRTSAALSLLLGIDSVGRATQPEVAAAASAAAGRLVAGGVSSPRWSAALAEPITVGDCVLMR